MSNYILIKIRKLSNYYHMQNWLKIKGTPKFEFQVKSEFKFSKRLKYYHLPLAWGPTDPSSSVNCAFPTEVRVIVLKGIL